MPQESLRVKPITNNQQLLNLTFDLNKSLEILERTPGVLDSLLNGLSDDWVLHNEGENTWSPYDVAGHLIHGEKTDWIPRMEIILSSNPNKSFVPFDRFAMFHDSKGKTLQDLLSEFRQLRQQSLARLKQENITAEKLEMTGIHPQFGKVTLRQLLSTWVVHDLGHIAQVSRVMAKQYKGEVGPWTEYLGILK